VIGGGVSVNGQPLVAGDQARIADETELKIQAKQDSELILLDVPDVRE
jgi:redox-sensitive bicupin YhaK (pirin superfamily)